MVPPFHMQENAGMYWYVYHFPEADECRLTLSNLVYHKAWPTPQISIKALPKILLVKYV